MDAHRLDEARRKWQMFIAHAFATRLDPDKFKQFAPLQQSRNPLLPTDIADILLRPDYGNSYVLDLLAPPYLKGLLEEKLVSTAAALYALYQYSTSHTEAANDGTGKEEGGEASTGKQEPLRWGNSYIMEEVIFYRLTKSVGQGHAVSSSKDAVDMIKITNRWMHLFSSVSAAYNTDVMGTIRRAHLKLEMENSRAAFVMLLLGVCHNQLVLNVLSRQSAKLARKQLSDTLAKFVPTLPPNATEPATRLEIFRTQTLAGFEPFDKNKEAEDAQVYEVFDQTVGLDNFQVRELPIENTRAGLYIYLNAALVGRPLIDDTAFFAYLHNRYQGDLQTTAVHLILASFDVLANAVFRNEGPKSGQLLRSYLINKVPLLLASMVHSSTLYPFNAEFCITQALNQVDTNVFPTLSNMFDISNTHNTFTETVRQDFFFACLLHGLVSESSRDKILGDITFQELPNGGRYVKDVLVQQCLQDPERVKELIEEIERMEGNAGAVCQALAEVLVQLCRNKETMSLKQWCGQLARKPQSLDILLLFNGPGLILQSLCELLDGWRYDANREDQGEYLLVYEEFSSVLLLLLALAYRYDLSAADLKIRSSDSFVGKLLSKTHHARHLDDLSDQEKNQIGGWIHGLFDSEANGLGDELMSSCAPQDFYLLIPTLFEQIVLAVSTGHLTEAVLKGGLEYLVEPFLLPSLIPALLYLCHRLSIDQRDEQTAVIKILQLIVPPNSISNEEASGMLSCVLNIVAVPLEGALRSYLKQDPRNPGIEPLLRALRESVPLSRRTGGADNNELETWSGTAGGSLTAMVRHIMQSIMQWCQNPAPGNGIPPSYTHRQVIVATQMVGAERLLSAMLEELKQQTEAGNGSVAYDVATALVCAPDVTNDASLLLQPTTMPLLDEAGHMPAQLQRRIPLRAALKHAAGNWKKIQKTDPSMAEIVVRLYRRVEAQMALPQPSLAQNLALDVGNAELNAIAAAAAADQGDHLTLDTSVDMGMGGGADLNLASAANSAVGLDMSEQDIFGALSDTGDFNLSWAADMDLT